VRPARQAASSPTPDRLVRCAPLQRQ
jgi:hypothetical protein